MKIKLYYESIKFRLKDWKKIRNLIVKVISEEGKFSGDLNFILADDKFIREINKKFLNHDANTDVISFNYDNEDNVNGEIYISIESVKRNANNYKVSYKSEVLRVMIHGVLHLCGYVDEYEEEKIIIHAREDYWMNQMT